jgi:hypothetical protein
MTAAQDEAWIQGSLARLETLEAQRAQLAASGQTAALAEIDEEIHALYEVLESAAGEDAAANTGMAPAPAPMGMAPAPAPMGMAPAPAPMGMAPAPAPMGMAPAPAPMGMAPAPAPMGSGFDPMQAPASYDAAGDDDIKPSRSPLPFILVGVLVVGGGIAGAVMMRGDKQQEAKPAATEPAREIKSGAIVEDTQEPQVAKGADADRTAGTKLKESPEAERADPRRPSSGGTSSAPSRPRPKKEDDGRKITVEKSRDPLAGLD